MRGAAHAPGSHHLDRRHAGWGADRLGAGRPWPPSPRPASGPACPDLRRCRPDADATKVSLVWTDAHHLIAWYLGGRTDIDQLICLCRWHHTRVHEGQWRIRLDPTTGDVHVTRPDGTPYELGPSHPTSDPPESRDLGGSDQGAAR